MFQFLDFWLSFMAVVSTFVYLSTISEVHKRAIHTAVAILTALMAITKATRYFKLINVVVHLLYQSYVSSYVNHPTKFNLAGLLMLFS